MVDQLFRLHEELRQARTLLAGYRELLLSIRRAILPDHVPEVPGLDLAVHFVAVDEVGGDFYDIQPADQGRWAIMIADACGHGLTAPATTAVGLLDHVMGRLRAFSSGERLVNRISIPVTHTPGYRR